MTFKTIVVHADDNPRYAQQLDVGIRLALDFEAQLVGLYVVPSFAELTPSVAALLPADIVEKRLRDAAGAQHRAEAVFREATTAAKLRAIEWRAPAGSATDAAIAHARCADLVIVGQAQPEGPGAVSARELATSIMLSAGRPVLFVPYIGAQPKVGQNVLVAWDGGREAARAIGDALPILARAKRVVIMSFGEDADHSAADAQSQSRLIAYLRRHGIESTGKPYDGRQGAVTEQLLSSAADYGMDLIVMGGYGHARLREWALGGVTRSILESMTVPVLMSH